MKTSRRGAKDTKGTVKVIDRKISDNAITKENTNKQTNKQ